MTIYSIYAVSSLSYIGEDSLKSYGLTPSSSSYSTETDQELKPGDYIVGACGDSLSNFVVLGEVSTKGRAGSYSNYDLVSVIDTTAIQQKRQDEKDKARLKAELDKIVLVQAEIDKYAKYEDANPVVKEKLNQLRKLMGLKVNGKAAT